MYYYAPPPLPANIADFETHSTRYALIILRRSVVGVEGEVLIVAVFSTSPSNVSTLHRRIGVDSRVYLTDFPKYFMQNVVQVLAVSVCHELSYNIWQYVNVLPN